VITLKKCKTPIAHPATPHCAVNQDRIRLFGVKMLASMGLIVLSLGDKNKRHLPAYSVLH